MSAAPRSARLAAEALGTAMLLATVVGSGIMGERLAAGNAAIALLANAIATGCALYALITVFGPISGAHFNPLVTLVEVAERKLRLTDGALFVLAQLIGAVAGVLAAHTMFELPLWSEFARPRTGVAQWWSESVATFGLFMMILLGAKYRPDALPAIVATYITAAYWFTASTSFANPIVTIARSLTATFAGIRPIDAPGFIAAQCVGALLAYGCCRWLGNRPAATIKR